MEKIADGTSVWRCERAEHKAARKYEQERSKLMEKLFAKLQAEFEKESDNMCKLNLDVVYAMTIYLLVFGLLKVQRIQNANSTVNTDIQITGVLFILGGFS